MTVWYGHVWFEHGVIQSAVVAGWQVPHGPWEGAVLVQWPGETGLPRVVAGGGWHMDRVSAQAEVRERLRWIGKAAIDRAQEMLEGQA